MRVTSSTVSAAPVVALVVLACVLACAGCGSQSQAGSGHTTPVAQAGHGRSKLVAAADPVCKRVAERRKADNEAVRAASKSSAETLHVLARLAPGLAAEQHSLARFLSTQKPGASEAHDWQAMVAGVRQLADDTTQIAAAAKTSDLAAVHSIDASGRLVQKRLAVIAARDGFTYCGPAT